MKSVQKLMKIAIVQTAKSKLRKNLTVEHACPLCLYKDGRIVHGTRTKGNDHRVSVKLECPKGSKPIALWHNHPGGVAVLSPADIRTTRQFGLPVCCVTEDSGKTRCYDVRLPVD